MKKFIILLGLALILGLACFSQSPKSIHYQAVARDALGNVIPDHEVNIRISILEGSENGSPVYEETHLTTTNSFGLVYFNIGEGTVERGDFSSIAWDDNKYFLKVGMDIDGGSDFKEMGISQIVSVPYAQYADRAGNVFSGAYTDLSGKPDFNDYVLFEQTSTWDKDTSNEMQLLAISGYTLSISGKNDITLPDSVRKAKYAANPADNFQLDYQFILNKPFLTISGDSISLTDGGPVVLPDTIMYANIAGSPAPGFLLNFDQLFNKPSLDTSIVNELQVISIKDDTVFLTDGEYAVLPDTIEFAEKAASSDRVESRLDSLIAGLDSVNASNTSRANTFWLSDNDGFFIDERDKQRYDFVLIGEQVWMSENMNIGDTIGVSEIPSSNDTIEKYAYDDVSDTLSDYGGLYTWREMMQLGDSCRTKNCSGLIQDMHQGICPTGWHVPSETDWQELIDHLGATPGGKMKETGTDHWDSPNTGATNGSGFTALPGGKREDPFYSKMGETAFFGIAKEVDATTSSSYQLRFDAEDINAGNISKEAAISVRCIKDE